MKKIYQYLNNISKNKTILYIYLLFLVLFPILYNNNYYNTLVFDISAAIKNIKDGVSVNLIPFRTIYTYCKDIFFIPYYLFILLGNILIYVPVGMFLNENKIIIISTIILKEVIQFILNVGSCDIDIIILNILGAILGMLILKFLSIKYKQFAD